MVNAPNGEVQIHQSDVWDPSLHRDNLDIDHERKFKPRETLVEYCKKNDRSDCLAET